MDTIDQLYLDFSHGPIVSPLKQAFKIELYNDTFFLSNSKHIINPSLNQPFYALDIPVFTEQMLTPIIPSTASLFEYSIAHIPAIKCINTAVYDPILKTNSNLSDAFFSFSIPLRVQCDADGTSSKLVWNPLYV